MKPDLETLIGAYDRGVLSRRDLLTALATVVTAIQARAAEAPLGPIKQLNHVTVFVPDVKKSVDFYQSTFGMPVLTRQDPGVNLNTGTGFLGIYPTPNGARGSINHLCLAVDNFDADRVLKTLQDRGVPARIRQRGDTKELYLTDPDGISLQLQDSSYIGGTGPFGNRRP